MKRLVAISAVLVMAVAAPAASAVKHNRITMSALGPLRLGMNRPAEKKALRQLRPGSLRWVHDTHVKGGLTYREYSYYRGYGVDTYTIGFLGPRGKPRLLRVARIVTYMRSDRTGRGAHVGTGVDDLYRMYGNSMQCGQTVADYRRTFRPCRVGAARRRHIVLLLASSGNDSALKAVDRIVVEEPGVNVPIFPP